MACSTLGAGSALILVHEAEHRIELLGFQPECLGERLDDLRGRPVVPPLDLAQVRVRHARHPRQVSLRHLSEPSLRAHEFSEGDQHRIVVRHRTIVRQFIIITDLVSV